MWLVLVGAFAVRFAWRHAADLRAVDMGIGWGPWILSFLCILGAKALITGMVHVSWRAAGADLGLRRAALTYNLSQLPKYLPGGIWPYVSRVQLARHGPVATPRIVRGLALETTLLLGGAVAVAAVAADVSSLLGALGAAALVPAVPLARAGALGAQAVGVGILARRLARPADLVRGVALALGAWALLGTSFAVLASGGEGADGVAMAGLFAAAWSVGFVAVFAPAGVGVRELLLAAGLAGMGGGPWAASVVVAHRLLYLAADALCAAAAWLALREGR